MLTSNLLYSTNAAAAIYLPLSGSMEATAGGVNTFAARATVIPFACTIKKLYIFNSSFSTGSAGVRIYRSEAGTGTPTDMGTFVAANFGAGNSVTTNLAVAAGDRLAYYVTPGTVNQTIAASIGLLCQ
jgi:hypothetical protein